MNPDLDDTLSSLIARGHRAESEGNPLPVVGSAHFRHSDAGGCARKIAYTMAGLAATNPVDDTSFHSFAVGHAIHDLWQRFASDGVLPDGWKVDVEAEFTIPRLVEAGERPLTGCHVDAVLTLPDGRRQAVEVKSINEYAMQDAVLKGGGPRWSHLIQVALNAKAADCDDAVIVYIPLTSVSVGRAERAGIEQAQRHGAQWTIPRERWEPIADWELWRVAWIKERVEAAGPTSVPRWWPEKEEAPGSTPKIIADPTRVTFPCRDYCAQFSRCVEDGA